LLRAETGSDHHQADAPVPVKVGRNWGRIVALGTPLPVCNFTWDCVDQLFTFNSLRFFEIA
jgi:hypothetical protein